MFSRGTKVSLHRSVKSTSVLPCGRAAVKKRQRLRSCCKCLKSWEAQPLLKLPFWRVQAQPLLKLPCWRAQAPNFAFFHFLKTLRTLLGQVAVARAGSVHCEHMQHFWRKCHWWLDKWCEWHLREHHASCWKKTLKKKKILQLGHACILSSPATKFKIRQALTDRWVPLLHQFKQWMVPGATACPGSAAWILVASAWQKMRFRAYSRQGSKAVCLQKSSKFWV